MTNEEYTIIEDFKNSLQNGNVDEAVDFLCHDEVLTSENIYKLCSQLKDGNIRPVFVVIAISNLLEKTKNETRESAFKLLLMGLKTNNKDFCEEVLTQTFLRNIHQTIPFLTQSFQKDVIYLLHGWSCAIPKDAKYSALPDLCKILKVEGYQFPQEEFKLDFKSSLPPWTDANNCEICKATFSTITRKHHCRNCGKTICSKCSSNSIPLPHFYILKNVRVCQKCFDEINDAKYGSGLFDITRMHRDKVFIKPSPMINNEISEENDPDLKRAIELSLLEASPQKKETYQPSPSPIVEYPTCSAPAYPVIEDNFHYYSLPQEIESKKMNISSEDPVFENLSSAMISLNEKIIQVKSDGKPAFQNQSLHTLFQATLATYKVFVTSFENNEKEILQHQGYLQLLDKIEKARTFLNDSRRMNTMKMMELKRESETLMRIQMEQKMQLIQQQQMEMEQYKQCLNEKRFREISSDNKVDQDTLTSTQTMNPSNVVYQNYPQYNQPNQNDFNKYEYPPSNIPANTFGMESSNQIDFSFNQNSAQNLQDERNQDVPKRPLSPNSLIDELINFEPSKK